MPVPAVYLLLMFFVAAALAFLFYRNIEDFMIFYPDRAFVSLPQDHGLSAEDVLIDTADGAQIHGWFFPARPEAPVVLFCHGNAGNISHRIENIRHLLAEGLQVFIFDYRGYGRSPGRPSERGVVLDGLSAYDYLAVERRIPPRRVIAFGRSLGASVAMEIALRREIGGLILESAFTSLRQMAGTLWLFRPVSFFLPNHYDNLGKIRRIAVPKLLIHGDRDEIVPYDMGRRLFDAAAPPKRFYGIAGAGHNDTYVIGGRAYFDAFAAFAMAPDADLSAPFRAPRPGHAPPGSPFGPSPPAPSR